jgi:hypothetical protein
MIAFRALNPDIHNFEIIIGKEMRQYEELHKVFSGEDTQKMTDLVKNIIYEKTEKELDLEYDPDKRNNLCACGGNAMRYGFKSRDPKKKAMIYCKYKKSINLITSYKIHAWWGGDTFEGWVGDEKVEDSRGIIKTTLLEEPEERILDYPPDCDSSS